MTMFPAASRALSCWLGLAAVASLPEASAAPIRWERLASLPVGNGGFVAAAIGDQVVLAGGTTWQGDTKRWLDQIWTYDPSRNLWREAGRLAAPVAYAATGMGQGSLWFAGGSSGTETHRSLWRLNETLTPQRVAPLDRGVVYAASAIIGSTLYVVGGTDDQAALDRVGNVFVAIDLKTGASTRLPDYPEPGLTTGTAAAVGGRLCVFGGARWDPAKKTVVNHGTAHVYLPATKRWEALPRLPHPGRGLTAVALDDRHLLIAGGYRNDTVEFVADAYVFEVQSQTYTTTIPLPYAGMVGLVRAGEFLYCLGGEDRKKHRSGAVFRIKWAELLAARQ
jgi:N-acetylneuraminic acid mutarotase